MRGSVAGIHRPGPIRGQLEKRGRPACNRPTGRPPPPHSTRKGKIQLCAQNLRAIQCVEQVSTHDMRGESLRQRCVTSARMPITMAFSHDLPLRSKGGLWLAAWGRCHVPRLRLYENACLGECQGVIGNLAESGGQESWQRRWAFSGQQSAFSRRNETFTIRHR